MSRRQMNRFIATVVAITALSAAGPPAGGQSRSAAMGPAETVLEPREDGTYWLPVAGMESVVLRFEPGEMPIELVSLRIDEQDDTIVADLRLTGDKAVTAWQVELESIESDGRTASTATFGSDWALTVEPRATGAGTSRATPKRHGQEGLFLPGQIKSLDLGRRIDPSLDEVVLSVVLLVFDDTSYGGSARLARDVLEDRAMGAEELARWLDRIVTMLDSAASDRELAIAVEELVVEMRAAPDVPLRPSPSALRNTLRINLEVLLKDGPSHGSTRSRLQDELRWQQKTLERWIEHAPRELPEKESAPRTFLSKSHFEGHEDDPVGDPDLDCECGGSISDQVARNESMLCNASAGWTVNENWTITCLNESGSSVGKSSGTLSGFGACIDGSPCFPDTYCPPEFHGPDVYEEEGSRYWHRFVSNRQVLVGPCFTTARCDYVPPANSLLLECPCNPMPQPRCYFDGCPILIETGAGGFRLTSLDDGVAFDLDGDGFPDRVAWTAPGGDDGWLVLDRNGNGRIDDATELFGDQTPQPPSDERHGFLALAVFDSPSHGGNGDGVISAQDTIFPSLRLWLDHDHDGVSDLGELVPLASADIAAIDLDYFRSERRDRYGNQFRYSAQIWLASGGRRLATDVFLQHE